MELNCKSCGHRWYSRKPEKPVVCPRCKSYHWDEERETTKARAGIKATNQNRPVAPIGGKV